MAIVAGGEGRYMSDRSVLVVSHRSRPDGFGLKPGYASFSEAEDVLASCSDADLVLVERDLGDPYIRARRIAGRALRRTRGAGAVLPASSRVGSVVAPPPRRRYDLVVFLAFTIWDLILLEAAPELRAIGDRAVAWLPEVWAAELDERRSHLEPFQLVDALFIGMRPAARTLARLTSTPVHYLPVAVDVARFGAGSPDGHRPIDVLGIGRRDPELHHHLLEWSRTTGRYYQYDTIAGAKVTDPVAHRENLGDTYLRSSVALTSYAKHDLPEITRGRREIPGRFFEALASGAIMIGVPPDPVEQRALTGHELVHELPSEPGLAVERIEQLVAGPDVERRRLQMQLALRGHDWAHRWVEVFDQIDLDPPPGLRDRVEQLGEKSAALDDPG
jgi:hypothetical protein